MIFSSCRIPRLCESPRLKSAICYSTTPFNLVLRPHGPRAACKIAYAVHTAHPLQDGPDTAPMVRSLELEIEAQVHLAGFRIFDQGLSRPLDMNLAVEHQVGTVRD